MFLPEHTFLKRMNSVTVSLRLATLVCRSCGHRVFIIPSFCVAAPDTNLKQTAASNGPFKLISTLNPR